MIAQDRKRSLIGFGVLAAVLIVAVLVLWPPPYFDKGGATGAIGAVEKHRAPQITPQDVILGDEATRHQENILYADLLKDAASLQNISVELQAGGAAARSALEAHRAELQTRFAVNARQTLNGWSLLCLLFGICSKSLESEIEQLSARFRSEEELQSEEIEALSVRLKNIAEQLEARAAEARKLASEDELQRAVSALEARKTLDNEDVEDLSARLNAIAMDLQAARLHAAPAYFEAMALEMRALKPAEEQLGKVSMQDISARLRSQAQDLEARAVDNLEARLQSEEQLASRLNIIAVLIGSAKRMVESKAALDSRAQERFNAALQNAEKALEVRKAGADQLERRINYELAAIDQYLGRAARLGNRESAAAFQKYLGSLDQALSGNEAFASLEQRGKFASQARELGRKAGGQQIEY